jgi:phospholipid/cholesterol/gamma-HCH transport system permease protein
VNDFLSIDSLGDVLRVRISGVWTFDTLSELETAAASVEPQPGQDVRFVCGELQRIDIAGAWVLHDRAQQLSELGFDSDFEGFSAEHFKFLQQIIDAAAIREFQPEEPGQRRASGFRHRVENIGAASSRSFEDLGIMGETFRHVLETGARAVPIVATITFLVGIVLAYQASSQLEQFGAKVFVVDLVSIAVMREMAGLMAAVMVAGRSGSAFAAALGTMKLNEEIDALRVMGLNPNQILVLPRVLGLLIALPLLTVLADLAGLAGGALIAIGSLDISMMQFLERVADSTGLDDFYAGLVKAPFFALLIAMVSILRGLQVKHGAEELGQLTTKAVVQSIFLVIVADAYFTTLFTRIGF